MAPGDRPTVLSVWLWDQFTFPCLGLETRRGDKLGHLSLPRLTDRAAYFSICLYKRPTFANLSPCPPVSSSYLWTQNNQRSSQQGGYIPRRITPS